jgi:hypothetical protein
MSLPRFPSHGIALHDMLLLYRCKGRSNGLDRNPEQLAPRGRWSAQRTLQVAALRSFVKLTARFNRLLVDLVDLAKIGIHRVAP